MATTQLAAKRKVRDLMQGEDSLNGVRIFWGHPGKHMPAEFVIVGGINGDTQEATLGTRKRDEDYTINCVISIDLPGDNQEAATARAFDVYGVIEAVFQAAPTLDDLPGLLWALVTGPTALAEAFSDDGRVADLTFGIQCKARI